MLGPIDCTNFFISNCPYYSGDKKFEECMITLVITDLDPSLHAQLEAKATANHRSISKEAQALLQIAISTPAKVEDEDASEIRGCNRERHGGSVAQVWHHNLKAAPPWYPLG
jgi:plasmid stability protein